MKFIINGTITEKDALRVQVLKSAWRTHLIDWVEIIHNGITIYFATRGAK